MAQLSQVHFLSYIASLKTFDSRVEPPACYMMKQTCSFLCRRENSDIPLVVIGCVQEIEKRGKFKGLFGILNYISETFSTSFGEKFVKTPD